MDWHPHALSYPLLEGEDYEAFKADILANGQQETVKYRMIHGRKQGLDGRNRERACNDLGIKCRYEEVFIDDGDVEAYIDSHNLHRRHLTREQRQARVLTLRTDGRSTRQIAASLGVSQATVVNDLKAEPAPGEQNCSPEVRDGDHSTTPVADPKPLMVTGRDGKSYPATRQTDTKCAPEIPDRLRKIFEGVPVFEKARRLATQTANAVGEVEQTPVYLWAVKGTKHEEYSTVFRTAARTLKLMTPKCPCPECGAYEPSMDNDPCKKCDGKGYLTLDEKDE